MEEQTTFCPALLEIDEAIYCLDIHDHDEVTQTQKSAHNKQCDKEAFEKDYMEEQKDVERPEGIERLKPTRLPLDIAQADVKKFIPPDSRCWRGNLRAEWWGQLKPMKCVFAKLADFDSENECIKDMLKKLWRQYNFCNGLPLDECPVQGVFGPVPLDVD